ncbi:MAG: hypothetical protein JWN98_1848 [Abditibacteriota bacterium]|nr:hypothetical protein [Abditibacteriota bacterium]
MNAQKQLNQSRLVLCGMSNSAFGAGALALVAGLGWRAVGSAPAPVAKPAHTKAVAGSSEYRPSEFAGVQVRSRPAATAQKARGLRTSKHTPNWIYVKPGAPLPSPASRGPVTNGAAGKRIVAGRSRLGGNALYLPESSMPFASAQKAASGRVVLKCDRNAKLHSAAEHAKHTFRHSSVQRAR